MLSANRVLWFLLTFTVTVPAMLLLFRDGDLTRDTWFKSLAFAAVVAAVLAAALGRGRG
ncbi:hypothetical protein ACN20G_30175 (plasmid) [Streptomyces sp. BI20]|uniref:hypothetical protein n=1 Tax=Streptomyces sp. BI20 TaxID=3403460 RepID=UPI003C757283